MIKWSKPIGEIQVPDLWHIAQAELDLHAREKILTTWHLAHDLKDIHNELLEACRQALLLVETVDGFKAVAILRAAIAKAEGK